MNRTRTLLILCTVLASGMARPAFVFPRDSAIVVCQDKKNTQKIKLRRNGCNKKEDVVIDLTELLAGQGTNQNRIAELLAGQGTNQSRIAELLAAHSTIQGRLSAIERYLGLVCEGDPSRTLSVGNTGARGCGRFNGDRLGCDGAFESLDLREGSVSCFFDADQECVGCKPDREKAGFCTNRCIPK